MNLSKLEAFIDVRCSIGRGAVGCNETDAVGWYEIHAIDKTETDIVD